MRLHESSETLISSKYSCRLKNSVHRFRNTFNELTILVLAGKEFQSIMP